MASFGEQYLLFLKEAMEKAGTTTQLEKIIDALEMSTIDSCSIGKVSMRACDHNNLQPIWAGEIGWDATGEESTLILTRNTAKKYDNFDSMYHSCEDIASVRAKKIK